MIDLLIAFIFGVFVGSIVCTAILSLFIGAGNHDTEERR